MFKKLNYLSLKVAIYRNIKASVPFLEIFIAKVTVINNTFLIDSNRANLIFPSFDEVIED
jgi:hypothetical protein